MRDTLRRLTHRRLSEQERTRAFAAVAMLLLAVAALLTFTSTTPRHAARTAPRTLVAPTPPPTATEPSIDRASELDALATGRRFLSGYLPFLYGHARAQTIRAASTSLRRRLASHPPRVSPATRRRHPRVVRLTAQPLGRARWVVTATIADGGVATYPVELVVAGSRVVELEAE